ncbi:abortive infection family protein [Alkalihalobacillus sp. AL-G]|uniref:abortive infection family protein n=1 Tax=Alkalihalobacillus sp. AL-G TaxID=2926399 RepID=UPI00272D2B02|nr:abortive infection family protein [Alkalihalobacillus sp. AL-G]WLD91726.1 abortive infection family protein [Alkalihalobacillus sp. AL-G]
MTEVFELKKNDRFKLINEVALKLQQEMNTTEINLFLSGFTIEHNNETIVPSKRTHVINLLSKVSDSVVLQVASGLNINLHNNIEVINQLDNLLQENFLKNIIDDFNRSVSNIEKDSDQAIASASSTLESICKSLLDFFSTDYPKDQSLSSLVSKTFSLLDLSSAAHSDAEIKRILGGLTNAGLGIGVLRTGYSSAHGKGSKQYRLGKRHARLVVNSMATIGIFLLETYYEKYNMV